MKTIAAAITLTLAAGIAYAQSTPVGLWKTVDDETKQEKSYVRLTDTGGTLSGKVEKLLDPSKQDAKCDKCTDARKDKPVLGMILVEGLKKDKDDNHWEGGQILDPNNGKLYRVRMTPKDGGKQLEVRGYIGPFYRNQTWIRVE
jgi:uncharacterized protein (DUF2147 family)